MKETSEPPQDAKMIEFVANKPFMFMIRDDRTKSILFLGIYTKK